ncbi:MAG: ABC transporter ATP-binding protein [Spirochaetales bacterium]|nr:ABC transporter ATP-binding protein [Spirochaetales bacterium]
MKIIETQGLGHRFPDGTLALNGVNLVVEKGEFTILAGRNGSGKTVLMKHLKGLLTPSSGRVLIHGADLRHLPPEYRTTVGLVFQNPDSQFVGQTVMEDLRFGPENLRLPEEEIQRRVQRALDITSLRDKADRRPHTLSGGEKRRLAVAGVLALDPEVLVLDEPFSGLDLEGTKDVLRGILALHDLGHTILLITHEVEKVLAHAGRLVIMEHGRVVADDHPSALLQTAPRFGIHIPKKADLSDMTWIE